ncbi:hypothetical protein ACHAXT_006113 [Thalassiosira profunda]
MTSPKKASALSAALIVKHAKSAFPLLFEQAPSSVPISSVAQIVAAAYLAHRCYPTISLRDVLFCVLYPTYLAFANHIIFANNEIIRRRPKEHPHNAEANLAKFFSGGDAPWFARYMGLAATVGLVLPLATIFGAPEEVATLAIPHLFVLWVQIIGESATMFNPYSHRYITILIPIGFSVYRMNLAVEWFLGSASLYKSASAENGDSMWHTLGLVLSAANVLFWTYNLFVVLMLKVVPEYLKDELCESPDVRVVALPVVGEPKKGRKNA